MNITPILNTERLILRPFSPDDADALFALLQDEEVNTFLPMFPVKDLEEATNYLYERILQDNGIHFAICLQTDGIPIGHIHISGDDSHDLGYALRKEFWHRGIVSEAARTVVQFAKNSGIPYLTATQDVKNPRSRAVMQNVGMTYQYSYEEQWQPKDFPVTFRMYQINLDGQHDRVFMKYWARYPVHFVEEIGKE